MSAPKLIRPNSDYKQSFLDAVAEYQLEGRMSYLDIPYLDQFFDQFITNINDGIPHANRDFQDWVELVPQTSLWLVKDNEYIGTIDIRHRLNWHLEKWGGHIHVTIRPSQRQKGYGARALKMSLPYANHFGIDRALITIAPQNTTAIHSIEDLGAEFQDETKETDQFPAQRRYWLDTI